MKSVDLLKAFLAFGESYYFSLSKAVGGDGALSTAKEFRAALDALTFNGSEDHDVIGKATHLASILADDLQNREMMWAFAWELERIANIISRFPPNFG